MKKIIIFLIGTVFLFSEDKLEESVKEVDSKLKELRFELKKRYDEAFSFYENKEEDELFSLIEEIREIKGEIRYIEERWRRSFLDGKDEEAYAFWDQGETILSQLIMEYGASDYLYIIPPEIGSMRVTLFSSIPIPRSSWDEMVELILKQNGIGIKKLTPYLKKLYLVKHDLLAAEAIVDSMEDLKKIPKDDRIFFLFSPPVEQLKETRAFFERFSDQKRVTIAVAANKIVIVAFKKEIERLIALHSAIWQKDYGKVVETVALTKLDAKNVDKVIQAFFSSGSGKRRMPFLKTKVEDLSIIALEDNMTVVLVGEKKMVERAKDLIIRLEEQMEEPGERTIWWYTCKHSEPQEIADVLARVYNSLSFSTLPKKEKVEAKKEDKREKVRTTAYKPVMPVSPGFVQPGKIRDKKDVERYENFVVDPKTGSILMVVPKGILPKIKRLLKKLDVPKKMVQIDVLLVERKIQDRKQSGINILKLGQSGNKDKTEFSFDASSSARNKGILDFIFSMPKKGFPSVDLTLSFLMAQEDLKINANPSIIAINQTPAEISIVEELSINNGAIQLDTVSGVTVEKSYTRAQFGITIVMTPTIHLSAEKDGKGYVSLLTDITFDTTQSSQDDRPPVTRRHIQNEVRIADGETIILGGLRRQSKEDMRDKIPFLGDIPGVGKLFGSTKLVDSSTEMFIFITPRIIKDPVEDVRKERELFLKRRTGDIPEFLKKVEEAKKNEKKRLFKESMKVFFD